MTTNQKLSTTAHTARRILSALAIAALLALPVRGSLAMGLKENVVVSDNTIKLGDIFYGLERDEDRVLGVAPRPGQDMVLNARTLLRIAIALDLPWRPTNSGEQVVIRRDATIIGQAAIESHLKQAISAEGYAGDFKVRIPPDYTQIVLPRKEPATLEVTRVSVNQSKSSFEAVVAAPSADNPIQTFQVSGTIHPLITVPVLRQNIENGRIIGERDIDYIQVPESEFVQGTVTDEQALIGMTPRRFAIAGRPLRAGDLSAPQIVSRGQMVTVVLNDGVLNLTAKGKALENGAKGDLIRVVNISSNITIEAEVTGVNEVRVSAQ